MLMSEQLCPVLPESFFLEAAGRSGVGGKPKKDCGAILEINGKYSSS
jgi:hypothetical protein